MDTMPSLQNVLAFSEMKPFPLNGGHLAIWSVDNIGLRLVYKLKEA